jgi:membrane peptidoglycan carboxypeptidase
MQKKAQEIVKEEIDKLKDYKVTNGAALAIDAKTGDVIAYIGSADYSESQFDVVADGLRQPGSALKPIEFALAFEKGYTPSSVIMDYTPENYDKKYRGPVQIRFALGNSLNVPAVKMLAMLGVRDFLQKCYDMGLTTMAPTQHNINDLGLSASLGGGSTTLLDLTGAYSVFARGGSTADIQAIEEVTDYKGNVIYKKQKPKEKQVLSPEVSFLISHILSDNNARADTFGTSSYLNVSGKTVAVKTGTTNNKRDNWTIGYTKSVVLGVWVGNNDNSEMNQKIASGVTGASPIWNKVMKELLKEYKDGIMDKPDKVKAVEIDSYLGGLPKDNNPKRTEYFIEGTEPKDVSPYYKRLKISKSNGKIANDVEAKSGNYEEKDFIIITERDPLSTDGRNRWQEAIDAWAKEQNDDKYKYPTETSDSSSDGVVVSIKSPGNETKVDSNDIEVRAVITSVASIKQVKIWINGEEKKSLDGDRDDLTEKFNLPDGVYTLKIQAWNDKGKDSSSEVKFGVKKDWNGT